MEHSLPRTSAQSRGRPDSQPAVPPIALPIPLPIPLPIAPTLIRMDGPGPAARQQIALRAAGHEWSRLVRTQMTTAVTDHRSAVVREPWRPWAAPLWPYSQVLHAGVLLEAAQRTGADTSTNADTSTSADTATSAGTATKALVRGLEGYRQGPAYSAVRRPHAARRIVGDISRGPRYVDDNAWIALALEQRALLAPSASGADGTPEPLLRWLLAAQAPNGGVAWREGPTGLHACSTGATGLAAARAFLRTRDRTLLDAAARAADFLHDVLTVRDETVRKETVRDERGHDLVADNIDAAGRIETTLWTYNQGLAVGLDVMLHHAGRSGALRRAEHLAAAVLRWADRETLWSQPPCFNAVLMRNLRLLHDASPDVALAAFIDDYTDRVLDHVTSGSHDGLRRGAYPGSRVIDRAGDVQVLALAAIPSASHALLC